MAEATTVMDPNAPADGADTTELVAKPATGVMAVVQRVTGGKSLRQILPAAGAIVISVIGLAFFVISNQPERTTLYASLPEAEKARVVDALKNSGVDVILDPTTGDVVVPVADYHSSRMTLAAQGLPQSIPDGYNAISDIPMGSSKSVENVRLKQSQEIELARSISEINGLVAARVHLAIPEKIRLCPCVNTANSISFCADAERSFAVQPAGRSDHPSCVLVGSIHGQGRCHGG